MDGLAGMTFAEWMAALEWVAAGLGLINIALLVFRSVWNYAFGIASIVQPEVWKLGFGVISHSGIPT